MPIFAKIIA